MTVTCNLIIYGPRSRTDLFVPGYLSRFFNKAGLRIIAMNYTQNIRLTKREMTNPVEIKTVITAMNMFNLRVFIY